MIFVRTSLENAQQRNDLRSRKLPPEIVQKDWEKAKAASNEFKKLFGRDFVEITNDDTPADLKKKTGALYSRLMTWSSKFPSNKQALAWKERELTMKYTAVRGLAKE